MLAVRGKLKEPRSARAAGAAACSPIRGRSALVENFAGQWLELRNMRTSRPIRDLFPDFDENLREALRAGDRAVHREPAARRSQRRRAADRQLHVRQRAAGAALRHPDVYGSRFRRVTLADDQRGGLLGQGSLLTVTSYPNRTSPVLRGKWLLDNLLGAPPPPPPPDVPALQEQRRRTASRVGARAAGAAPQEPGLRELPRADGSARLRARELRRDRPLARPPSERHADRRVRRAARRHAVRGPARPAATLLAAPRASSLSTVTEKLLTYALGRGVEYYDLPAVRADRARRGGRATIAGRRSFWASSKSVPFQMRRVGSS